jgi:serine/threonine-protein kinase
LELQGRVLGGRFELLSPIGEGGYGAVYLARQISMDRNVAVKVIHPRVAIAQDFVDRFEREARVASKLQHPNTVVYFDFGRDEDVHFLAMEFVKGRTLGEAVVEEGPLPVARTAHLTRQICGALSEAHALGMVHRDLKPGNILLTNRGGDPDFVKVIDFGLAKIVQGDIDGSYQDVTSEGVLLGTPAYMAPEQIKGVPLDHRCDIYALGVIMFVMLTGKRPYEGDTPLGTAVKHLTEAIPFVREHNASVPAEMEQLVRRCMAKEPDRRPPNVDAVASELDLLMSHLGPTSSGSLYLKGERPDVSGADWPPLPSGSPPPTTTLDSTPSSRSGERLSSDLEDIGARASAPTMKVDEESASQELAGGAAPRMNKGLMAGLIVALCMAAVAMLVFVPRSREPGATTGERGIETAEVVIEPAAEGAAAPVLEVTASPGAELDIAAPANDDSVALSLSAETAPPFSEPGPYGEAVSSAQVQLTAALERSSGEPPGAAGGDGAADTAAGAPIEQRQVQRVDRQAEPPQPAGRERRREQGSLRINASPWGIVYCDGDSLGRTPIDRRVPLGTYDCLVVSPQGQEVRRRVRVVPDDDEVVQIRFDH